MQLDSRYSEEDQAAFRRYQNKINNAQGAYFEKCVKGAALYYRDQGQLVISKLSEPFKCLEKERNRNIAKVQFIAKADPDFMGTLFGGRSIVFETKLTSTDRLNYNVLTEAQATALDDHYKMGAASGIVCCIQSVNFFVPWSFWRDMKSIFGRKYVKTEDLEEYRVKFTGLVMFLNYVKKGAGAWLWVRD